MTPAHRGSSLAILQLLAMHTAVLLRDSDQVRVFLSPSEIHCAQLRQLESASLKLELSGQGRVLRPGTVTWNSSTLKTTPPESFPEVFGSLAWVDSVVAALGNRIHGVLHPDMQRSGRVPGKGATTCLQRERHVILRPPSLVESGAYI